MKHVIETQQLTKRYGSARGIDNVTLQVTQGEMFGFIGPNGAGKSTTIRTLLGLIRPTSGLARIFGQDIMTNGPAIRDRIGYLPSEVFYYDNMRVIDLLRYSASFYSASKNTTEARMHELAELLDLNLTKKIDDLSYGNKKKVGIVQGLQHAPDLIILDEPTGGLDPLIQATFFDLLQRENERGATVLFSSHILSEVQKLCDRVAIIREGQLVETQRIQELRKNSYLQCRLETAKKINPAVFTLEGISNCRIDKRTVQFIFRGDVNQLLKLLSTLPLTSITLDEPSLEDIFMHFYEKDTTIA